MDDSWGGVSSDSIWTSPPGKESWKTWLGIFSQKHLVMVRPAPVHFKPMTLSQSCHCEPSTLQLGHLPKDPDFAALHPFFGWLPAEHVKATIHNTTQLFCTSAQITLQQHFKTRHPGSHVKRLPETVATDSLIFVVPAADDGIQVMVDVPFVKSLLVLKPTLPMVPPWLQNPRFLMLC